MAGDSLNDIAEARKRVEQYEEIFSWRVQRFWTCKRPPTISLLEIQRSLIAQGHEVQYNIHSGADVAVARNMLAQAFIASGADIFVGIDDDVGISAAAFDAINAGGHDCVVAIVPRRDLDLGKFAQQVRAGKDDTQAMRSAAHPIGLSVGQTEGFFPIEYGTTSFYIVSRGVYESMMDPELTQKRGARSESGVITYWGFYNPGNDENGSYLSEDYSFFRRVRLSGGGQHSRILWAGPQPQWYANILYVSGMIWPNASKAHRVRQRKKVVGADGLEPPTLSV